jgi:hypothetical protein
MPTPPSKRRISAAQRRRKVGAQVLIAVMVLLMVFSIFVRASR